MSLREQPCLSGNIKRAILLHGVVALGFVVLVVFEAADVEVSQRFSGPFITLMILALLAILAITMHTAARNRERTIEAGGMVCLRCRHLLEGLGEEGQCPECGEAFEHQHNRRVWLNHYGVGESSRKHEIPD